MWGGPLEKWMKLPLTEECSRGESTAIAAPPLHHFQPLAAYSDRLTMRGFISEVGIRKRSPPCGAGSKETRELLQNI